MEQGKQPKGVMHGIPRLARLRLFFGMAYAAAYPNPTNTPSMIDASPALRAEMLWYFGITWRICLTSDFNTTILYSLL